MEITTYLLTNGGLAGLVLVICGLVIRDLRQEIKDVRETCAAREKEHETQLAELNEKRLGDLRDVSMKAVEAIMTTGNVIHTHTELLKEQRREKQISQNVP